MPAGRQDAAGGARAGTTAAALDDDFAAFVGIHHARLLHLAELIIGDEHRAQDLLQAVLAKTYLRWSRIRQQNPVGYVRTALIHARTDWWRRRSSSETPVAVVPEPRSIPDHGGQVADRDAIHRALAVLNRKERVVIVLRFYEDLELADIAAELNMPISTVKSLCARALTKLRISPSLSDMHSTDSLT
ncbi:RNA polymerase sigma-70 factor (sigma-E family) [Krasilnikovia cinnamomea]|uniref:RNA polymerase sigma-70 factor (Sigma-E family) n=2 Tax=Krasilnikovia cinnamomea TaxID=349313 RepID=A0A4Q7ZQL9_9ACTN|nr:RNA polymerase sigma-70 factor (sigma-E family) [Krasilnikovia cinnamomea]